MNFNLNHNKIEEKKRKFKKNKKYYLYNCLIKFNMN